MTGDRNKPAALPIEWAIVWRELDAAGRAWVSAVLRAQNGPQRVALLVEAWARLDEPLRAALLERLWSELGEPGARAAGPGSAQL